MIHRATFHRLRILAQTGSSEDVSRQIDQLLAQRTPVLSRSATNQFLALRMKYASNLQDLLHFAPRVSNDAAKGITTRNASVPRVRTAPGVRYARGHNPVPNWSVCVEPR